MFPGQPLQQAAALDSRHSVTALRKQTPATYPRLAHASYSLRKATTPKKPGSART